MEVARRSASPAARRSNSRLSNTSASPEEFDEEAETLMEVKRRLKEQRSNVCNGHTNGQLNGGGTNGTAEREDNGGEREKEGDVEQHEEMEEEEGNKEEDSGESMAGEEDGIEVEEVEAEGTASEEEVTGEVEEVEEEAAAITTQDEEGESELALIDSSYVVTDNLCVEHTVASSPDVTSNVRTEIEDPTMMEAEQCLPDEGQEGQEDVNINIQEESGVQEGLGEGVAGSEEVQEVQEESQEVETSDRPDEQSPARLSDEAGSSVSSGLSSYLDKLSASEQDVAESQSSSPEHPMVFPRIAGRRALNTPDRNLQLDDSFATRSEPSLRAMPRTRGMKRAAGETSLAPAKRAKPGFLERWSPFKQRVDIQTIIPGRVGWLLSPFQARKKLEGQETVEAENNKSEKGEGQGADQGAGRGVEEGGKKGFCVVM